MVRLVLVALGIEFLNFKACFAIENLKKGYIWYCVELRRSLVAGKQLVGDET